MVKRQLSGLILVALALVACSQEPGVSEPPAWRVPATSDFVERQAAYLAHCASQHGPGKGGRHGQACLVATGSGDYNREVLAERFAKIRARKDTSDFDLTSLLRMLYLDPQNGVLPGDIRSEIEDVVLGFKYWLDEPGPDTMVWWSENHQILFHALEYLAGHLYPERVFYNSGMTGREHMDHARPLLLRWLYNRARFGFSEFHSNVYFDEDMPALINLVDFAPDEEIRGKAAIILDMIALDMASNYYKGSFATAHGRTYPDRLLSGLRDSTRDAAWIMLGLGPVTSVTQLEGSSFSATMLATSQNYNPPPLLEAYARLTAGGLEHRQRDSIRIQDGPAWGISYDQWQDVVFWWGMTGYIAPEIISGSLRMVDNFDMWQGDNWSDLTLLTPFVGTSVPQRVATEFAPMARGIVLEEANTYVYRTPHYQLAGVQDYKPSSWTGQVHVWAATLTDKAYVFTTYPGGSSGSYASGDWTGGFVPRATLDRAVSIIQYRRPQLPEAAEGLLQFVEDAGFGLKFKDYSHAYFPRHEFDEVVTAAGWTIGREGDAWIGLWSQHPVSWSTENDYELIAPARENVWVVQLGSAQEQGDFASFVRGLEQAEIAVGSQGVRYESPWQGSYHADWTGPFTRDGEVLSLGPYLRWDNPHVQQDFGTRRTVVNVQGRELVLDFDSASRSVK